MGLVQGLRARLRAIRQRAATDRELDEEISYHLERETEKNLGLGMTRAEARRAALVQFGGVQRAREDHRDVRRVSWLEDFLSDTRFALRSLRRTPGIAGAAVITLALGIAANVAIFSAVNAVILRPLPFPQADRLVVIGEDNRETGVMFDDTTPANWLDWRAGVSAFDDAMAYINGVGQSSLTGRGDLRLVRTLRVSGNFFDVLGARPALGRPFRDDETWAAGGHVAMLSDRAWREHFGADPSVVGTTITLDGTALEVVGVMPPRFDFPTEEVEIWRSLAFSDEFRAGDGFKQAHYLRVVARLKSAATPEQAATQLRVISERLARDRPLFNEYATAAMRPLREVLAGPTRLPLLLLQTSVVLLLLIACANVGNLLLVQAAGRQRETSLRLALGAGRSRVVRQALAESLVLSGVGGACGLALGWMGTHVLVRMQPERMLPVQRFGVDGGVIAYVVAITIASALVFGLAPALWARHRDPAETLRSGGRAIAGGRHARRWGNALVVGEVGLALLIAVGAGLLARSLWHLGRVDPGFDTQGVLAVNYSLGSQYDTVTKVEAFNARLLERARGIPGVAQAAITDAVSLAGRGWQSDYIAAGRPADGYGTNVLHRIVSPTYFETMRIPLRRGRWFTPADTRGAPLLVVVNDVLARTYFQGQDPIGQRIAFDRAPTPDTEWYTIIGVVGAERTVSLDAEPVAEVYESAVQRPRQFGSLLIRTAGDPAALTATVRSLFREIDGNIPLYTVRTMETIRATSMSRAVFLTTLLVIFAVIGVVLAVVGVYGVLAHAARHRTREMGIRIALGAQVSEVRGLVVRDGLRLIGAGLLVGGVAAIASTRVLRTLLYNVAPNDPLTIALVAALLAVTGVLASWLPARRASRTDPMIALRAD
jgi:putative ABC transport system permease protein